MVNSTLAKTEQNSRRVLSSLPRNYTKMKQVNLEISFPASDTS